MEFYIYQRLRCEVWNEERQQWAVSLTDATAFKSRAAVTKAAEKLPTAIGELLILEFRGVK